jgi:hypothetical protein
MAANRSGSGSALIVPFRQQSQQPTGASVKTITQRNSSETSFIEPTASTGVPFNAAQGYLTTLQDLRGGRVLIHPLYVRIDPVEDGFTATSQDLSLVGRGESDLDALDDLRSQIAELFSDLESMRETLGPLPLDQLLFLERLATS